MEDRLPVEAAVMLLECIDGDDPEEAHIAAEAILLSAAPQEVRDAYWAVQDRCDGWWYA